MPIASASTTTQRLLSLLSLLESRRDWPAPVLAARLGVSERTVRRDVDRLRELDYAIEATRGPDGGYRLDAGARLPPMLFDEDQAVAVVLALRTAAPLGEELGDAAARARHALERLMPSHLAARVGALTVDAVAPAGAAPVDPAVPMTIGEAIRAGEELRFDYASPSAAASDGRPRTVEPHHLLLHAGRWYLLGWSRDREDWRTYRVDRVSPRSHRGRRFTPREVPGGDPARFLAARFKGSSGTDAWPCQGSAVVLGPLDSIAPYVRDGSVEEVGHGRFRVALGSWSWAGLAGRFAGFGLGLEEAEPAPLAAAFDQLAARAEVAAGTQRSVRGGA